METDVLDREGRRIVCPMSQRDDSCYGVGVATNEWVCAWWIPGAECCALVQIARRLSDLAALQGPYLEGIDID